MKEGHQIHAERTTPPVHGSDDPRVLRMCQMATEGIGGPAGSTGITGGVKGSSSVITA